MTAYYNEHDPKAAAWLRELIKQGHIAPGVVDERSIEDITPPDLEGYTQCHFFAGIGVWSYALRRAGWPDDKPVWTGSCPCQPFSAAGKGAGMSDERHLWPAWYHLITQCKPVVIFGEQVASKDGLGWLDPVQADLEGAGYTNGAIDLCAAGVGAPHIRQRLWFVAERVGDARSQRLQEQQRIGRTPQKATQSNTRETPKRTDASISGLGNTELPSKERQQQYSGKVVSEQEAKRLSLSGATSGFWKSVDWLPCADSKFRPVEPGTFPLVNGAAARVVRLRGYGNAINAEVAATFIEAYLSIDVVAS